MKKKNQPPLQIKKTTLPLKTKEITTNTNNIKNILFIKQ